jgi:hypothetical protein
VADAEAALHAASPRTTAISWPCSESGSRTARTHALTLSTRSRPTSPRTRPARPRRGWLRNFPKGSNAIAKGVYVPAWHPASATPGRRRPARDVVAALRELLKPPEPRGTPMAVAGSNAAFLGVESTDEAAGHRYLSMPCGAEAARTVCRRRRTSTVPLEQAAEGFPTPHPEQEFHRQVAPCS